MHCAMTVFATAIILMLGAHTGHAYVQSLADCKAVAAKFRNTCVHNDYSTPATSVAGMASETFDCADKWKCIPGGTVSDTGCSWERRLCVTCREVGGVTKIRVQTNNLPDHCVTATNVEAQNFDYEVNFNSKKTHGSWDMTLDTQDKLDNAVCPIKKGYDADAMGIVENGTEESVNAMGFALNGVAFQFANQIQEDPVSPKTMLNEQPLDMCLGHTQRNSDSGMYHYHDTSPCINAKFMEGKTMGSCVDDDGCKDTVAWVLSGFAATQTKTVIGIGKDGHVLYGPYDDAGDLWQPANVDPCNGAWSTDLSDYFYVSTRWHPYVVGCFGPSDFPHNTDKLYPQCSLNGIEQYMSDSTKTTTTMSPSTTTTTTTPLTGAAVSIAASLCVFTIPLLI